MNILDILRDCPEYAIMKIRDNFPAYTKGQDIDIACRDIEAVRVHISRKLWDKCDFKVTERSDKHIHFDVLTDNNQIDLRFDLYSEFISERLTKELLDNRERAGCVYVASTFYDGMVKCYEYLENGKKKYKSHGGFRKQLDSYR